MSHITERETVRLCARDRLQRILSRLKGKKVTLMGLGLFGGGEGAARFLCEAGAILTVTDLRSAERLQAPLHRLRGEPIKYRLGEHEKRDFVNADLVVANPAVPRNAAPLRAAQEAGVPLTSPMNMFLTLCRAPVVAVTGSNGKSTTTAMLRAMLEHAGHRVHMGGNMGVSLLPQLRQLRRTDTVVLELSSFQLEDAALLRWSPRVCIVTNLAPNHLDRHQTFGQYVAAKKNIAQFQTSKDSIVLNSACRHMQQWVREGLAGKVVLFGPPVRDISAPRMALQRGRIVWHSHFSTEIICSTDDVPLPGKHNVENALAAAAGARRMGASPQAIRAALLECEPLEHRLEPFAEINGIRFYNDSLATTPQSTIAALRTFDAPVTLIAGGYDKKLDLRPLAAEIADGVEVLVTLGQTGPVIAQHTREASLHNDRALVVKEVKSFEDAVKVALELSMPGSVVLLSPACASYGMFDNFAERGNLFKKLVKDFHAKGRQRRPSA